VFYDTLAEYLGVAPPKIPPAWMAPLLGSTGRLLARSQRMSNGKFRAAAGWAPKFPSVREGFRAALAEVK
jgi:nucleoside-diphosphate-sugar epimerase